MALKAEHGQPGNSLFDFLNRWVNHHGDGKRDVLVLNVVLLGGPQSGRSSVGNALLGGDEFQTGRSISGVTTECRLLWRTFPRFFRRQGVETDMMLRIVDTPPGVPDPLSIHQLCPEGVHVLGIVVRADLPHEGKHLQQHAEKLLGPEWHQHSILILTHSDHLRETGLQPSAYLAQPFTGWLRNLAGEIRGGVWFLDNTSDWSSVRGRPLRDQILCLSAKNHHRALTIRTSV
ncbi:GTPase IMAP family member GIMD1 [Haplochromis burtoni]|uniref:GTPase IMAP family member GIMD1-like n=1 Tax=Haplochromis burtoni TaxID=8153 RepID=A0A3Q3C6L1_HAPBU|nr:GTPase IMAP family member GIMD1 [Haplochromis burtoni]